MTLHAVNGNLGIAPFAKGKQVEKRLVGGMAVVAQGVEMVSAKVLIGSKTIPAGSTVYFRGQAVTLGWAKLIHTIDGVEYLQAPEAEVIFVAAAESHATVTWTIDPWLGHPLVSHGDCPPGTVTIGSPTAGGATCAP